MYCDCESAGILNQSLSKRSYPSIVQLTSVGWLDLHRPKFWVHLLCLGRFTGAADDGRICVIQLL